MQRHAWRALLFVFALALVDRGLGMLLEQGLRRYYGLDQPADVVCIGHSRTVLGIDEVRLGERLGVRIAKYAVQGATTADREAMVAHYRFLHPGVRLVLYDVEASTFADDGLSANSYRLFYPFMDDAPMRAHLWRQRADLAEYGLRRLVWTARYEDATLALAVRGWFGLRGNLKTGTVDLQRVETRLRTGKVRPVRIDAANLARFRGLAEALDAAGIDLVLIEMPTVDLVNARQTEAREEVAREFAALAARLPHVRYLDLHAALATRHDLFHDEIHLNATGKHVFTEHLADQLALEH